MQKSLNLLLLAIAFIFCNVASAQTTDYKLKQQQFLQNVKAKHSLSARFKHNSESGKTKIRAKGETKKVPSSLVFVNWSEADNAWTDTSEKYTITWNTNGTPNQVILDMNDGDNGFPEKIIITDWFKMDDSSLDDFSYLFNGENYMFRNALAKVYIAGMWVNYQRYTVKFTSNNLVSEQLVEEFNGVSWANSSRTTFTYNQQNQNTEVVDEEWKNGAWVGNYKGTYAYDANGNTTEEISYDWNNGRWVISYGNKNTITYNSSNQVTSIEQHYYESGQQAWMPTNKQVYTLNAAGEITDATGYSYSFDKNEWVESILYNNIVWQKFDKTYFGSNPIIVGGEDVKSYDQKSWNGNSWDSSGRAVNQYNAAGLQTSTSFESYYNGVYTQVQKTTTSYYSNNDVKEFMYFSPTNLGTLAHAGGYDFVNTYDAEGDKTDEIYRNWDPENSIYKNQYRTITTFTTITTGLQELQANTNIAIYPNPAVNGKINISLGQLAAKNVQVDIYDNTGKTVFHANKNTTNNITLDVNSLPKGLYFISINSDNKVSKSRFTIQ